MDASGQVHLVARSKPSRPRMPRMSACRMGRFTQVVWKCGFCLMGSFILTVTDSSIYPRPPDSHQSLIPVHPFMSPLATQLGVLSQQDWHTSHLSCGPVHVPVGPPRILGQGGLHMVWHNDEGWVSEYEPQHHPVGLRMRCGSVNGMLFAGTELSLPIDTAWHSLLSPGSTAAPISSCEGSA